MKYGINYYDQMNNQKQEILNLIGQLAYPQVKKEVKR
jgi:hypothetical protein